jgi:hypothetical protein
MAPITIYASTMSGITWRAVTGQAVSEHLLMIEISKAGKHGLLLEESRPWDATCKVWRCPRPSGIPKYLWALIEQKLRQIKPMAVAPSGEQHQKAPAEKPSSVKKILRTLPGASGHEQSGLAKVSTWPIVGSVSNLSCPQDGAHPVQALRSLYNIFHSILQAHEIN